MIAYVDPLSGGHHADLLLFFAEAFEALGLAFEVHVPTMSWAAACADYPALSARPFQALEPDQSLGRRLQTLGSDARIDLVLFGTLDPVLWPLLGLSVAGKFAPRWSGLFLRDSFNAIGGPLPLSLRLKAQPKLWALRQVCEKGCAGVLTLNPYWTAALACPVFVVPDSLSQIDRGLSGAAWPRQRQVRDDGRVALLSYGGVSQRKGTRELLEAMSALNDAEVRRLALRIIGPATDRAYLGTVEDEIAALRARGAEIETDYRFLSTQAISDAVTACDVIVAPYQNHVGSSGVIGQAIQAGRPVLGQGQHQMGAEIRDNDLGFATDGPGKTSLTEGLHYFLTQDRMASDGMRALRERRNYAAAQSAVQAALRAMLQMRIGDGVALTQRLAQHGGGVSVR